MKRTFLKYVLLMTIGYVYWSESACAQQNIQFTQYVFNSLSINPAYAGYKEEWFAQMALRAQWLGVEGAPKTAVFSIDGILDPRDRKMGLGFQITSDRIGPQSANSATVNYAYRLQLDADDNQRLSFGIGAGLAQYTLKGDLLHSIDVGDQALPVGNDSSLKPDIRLGVYYNSNFFYIGASVTDVFFGPKAESYTSTPTSLKIDRSRHAYLIAGGLVNLNPDLRLRPSLLIKEDFKGPTSADLNMMIIINDKVWVGASYRTDLALWKKQYADLSKQNSISGVAQFFISERFRLGYSYDYVTSKLGSSQNGSHELTLGLAFGKVPRSMICPRVF
jgi:type IX secretion system PorP/SprF family membrane protein